MNNLWPTSESRKFALLAGLLLVLVLVFLRHVLFLPADMVLGEGYDMRGAYYLWHVAVREAVRAGQLPLWDPYLFGGYPFLVNPQVGLFYPPAWLIIVLPAHIGVSWYAVFHLWVAAVGMLLFVRAMSKSWLGGLLAGITFAFSAFVTARIWAGHLVPVATHVWLPWMLLALWFSVRRGNHWTAVATAIPFALAILAGHITSILYVGLIWGLFALYLLLAESERRTMVIRQAVIAGAVALALSGVQLLPLVQFSLQSTRIADSSFEFAANYSLPPAHLITLLVPEFFGEPIRAGYWSVPPFVELTIYAGVLPLLGLVLALRRPSRLTWFYLLLIALGLLLAVGSYGFLYRIFYDWLPPFRLARAPGRAAFLYVFAASALLGEAVAIWRRLPPAQARELLSRYWGVVMVAGIAAMLAALAATGAVFAAQHPTATSGRLWHQIGAWSLALLWFGVGGGLLWGLLTTATSAHRRIFGLCLALMLVADLWLFGAKMIQTSTTITEPFWREAREIIGETPERVLPWGVSVFWQNGPGEVGLRSVFGYNSLSTAVFEAFVSSVPDPRATSYDLLGATYVLSPQPQDRFTEGAGALTLLAQRDDLWVYRRERPLPIARLVYTYEIIPHESATINRIHAPGFDPVTTALLAEEPDCTLSGQGTGTAEISETAAGYWRIQTNSSTPALLILSETAYPGWQVTVNGVPAEWQTAYTLLRAVCVPAGESEVIWRFRPTIFWWGGLLSLLALFLIAFSLRCFPRAGH